MNSEYKQLREREQSLEQEISRIKKSCSNLEGKLRMSQNDLRNKSYKHDKECENIIRVFVNFLKKNKIKMDLTLKAEDEKVVSPFSAFSKNKFASDLNGNFYKQSNEKNTHSEKKNHEIVKAISGSQSYSNLNTNDGLGQGMSTHLASNQLSSFDKFKNNRISNLNAKLKSLIEMDKIQIPNSNMRAISRKIPKIT